MSYEQEINDFLNSHVPLFQAMQARLERCDDAGLTLIAPLAPNINDKGIAFGGAMAAIAALTGWRSPESPYANIARLPKLESPTAH